MRRIRSLEDLNKFLDDELAWRKKELTTLNFLVGRSRPHEEGILLRSAICLLYAHWEGFIKNAATGYICFVVAQRLKINELAPNFLALGLLSNIQRDQYNIRTVRRELIVTLTSGMSDRFSINCENVVSAESNLNMRLLNTILNLVGLDNSRYEEKKAILDQRLLANRNSVAHGEYLEIDSGDYSSLHSDIIQLIDRFRTDVENAAVLGRYRSNHQTV